MVQNRAPETERSVTRRSQYEPSREFFGLGPFSMMRRLWEDMDRTFSRWGEPGMWSPPIEVREKDGNLEVTAELPGMKKEDVKVECTDQGISIEGERRQEREENQGGFHRSERSYGRFYRMIPLPQGAQTDQAKAEFKDGLLKVRIPVPESKNKSRQIPISG